MPSKKMVGRNTVKLPHMALGLVPKSIDSVDVVLLVSEQRRVVDPEVVEFRDVQGLAAVKRI
jgi:hypothetical protein